MSVADIVVRHFADDLTVAEERIADLESDVAVYREMVSTALSQIVTLTASNRRLQARVRSLLEESNSTRRSAA